jgi:hypothetical protein
VTFDLPGEEPAVGEPLTASGDTVLQSETLESIGSAVEYRAWLTSLAQPYLGDHPIELGSGLGDYAQDWLDLGVPAITPTEVDPGRLAALRSRFAGDPRVTVKSINVFAPEPADHSSYVAYNVLEHISDHVAALRAAHTLVRPGGAVLMFVPAFGFAMSKFDRAVGHERRYTVGSLTAAFRAAGLDPVKVHYVNLPGLPAWVVGMRLLGMTPADGPLLRVWDRQVIPRARRWESRHTPWFGQSVLGVARVPAR